MCMPFGYKGCGGNGNKFISQDQCYEECPRPEDLTYTHLICDLGKEAELIKCQRDYNEHIQREEFSCPPGYKCLRLPFYEKCCNTTNMDIYGKNTDNKPKCKNGKNPSEYYGKSCEDEFCSSEEECIQLELFAHCCPK
uniref:BPTI/Kunitz inhibitor domain-containing protein n=1 Tax=Meloidogyne hapla TaxID=6305 RepID=A0A1I8B318_MELHA